MSAGRLPTRYTPGVDRRLFAWWYVSIALGFVLLALRSFVLGGNRWLTALRLVISAGFAALAWLEFRARPH